MFQSKYSILVLLLILFSCNPDDDSNAVDPTEPSNLTIDIEIFMDNSGKVAINANATNAVEYHFYMGENANLEPIIKPQGFHEHVYESLGTYIVEVRAYGSGGRFIRKTQQISVQSDAPPTVGEGYTTPTEYDCYNLVFSDEFTGTTLNSSNWTHEIGDGCPNICGWGNNELEYYRAENTTLSGGVLTIEARQETFGGRAYTSSRIISQGKQSFQYGRVDIRAVLPKGQGIWPALWMLGSNITQVGWPACGEIDIMELVGGNNRNHIIHGTGHWDNNGHNFTGTSYILDDGDFSDKFHVFSIIWDENQIEWFLDDNLFYTLDISTPGKSEFKNDFFLIMNIAVGGNWPGDPNSSTVFPQQMLVDYIRVFQKQ